MKHKKLLSTIFRFLEWQMATAIKWYAKGERDLYIIQVGSNDGVSLDPLHQVIKKSKAIVVEAVPFLYHKLQHTYSNYLNVKPMNLVVTDDAVIQEISFYYFKPKPGLPYNEQLGWWGSLSKEYVSKYTHGDAELQDLLVCEKLPCTTLNKLYLSSGFKKLDILHTDVEGLDFALINSLDFALVKPGLILFEHYHIPKEKVRILIERLNQLDYRCYSHGHDTLCIQRNKRYPDMLLRFIKWVKPSVLSPIQ